MKKILLVAVILLSGCASLGDKTSTAQLPDNSTIKTTAVETNKTEVKKIIPEKNKPSQPKEVVTKPEPPKEIRIDGSSEATYQDSYKKMQASLGNKDRCLLQAAAIRINIGETELYRQQNGHKPQEHISLANKLNGLNAKEIIKLSEVYPNQLFSICRD